MLPYAGLDLLEELEMREEPTSPMGDAERLDLPWAPGVLEEGEWEVPGEPTMP